MKKVLLVLFGVIILVGCRKSPIDIIQPVNPNAELKMSAIAGIKLQSQFVTSEVRNCRKCDS